MGKVLMFSTHVGFLLIAIILISSIKFSRASSLRSLPMADMSADDDEAEVEEERRMYDFNKLRRFLLTSNDEQRAAKREQQDFLKRELVNKLNFLFRKNLIKNFSFI